MSSPGRCAVVLLSGGLDSTTTLAIARSEGLECYALTIDYGQRHQVELDAARRVAQALGAREHVVLRVDLRRFGGSALTADLAIPARRDPRSMTDIPATYVPARNTVFLALALAWAETLGAEDLFIGVNALDYSVDGAAVVWVRSPSWARPMSIEDFYARPEGDYETIGVGPGRLEIGWRRVTRRVRHPAMHTRCFTIRLERGQTITISEDHSLFTPDPVTGRPVPVKGAQVETGMPIVVPVDLSGVADAWSRDMASVDLSQLPASHDGREGRRALAIVDGFITDRSGRMRLPLCFPVSDEFLYILGLWLAGNRQPPDSERRALAFSVGGIPGAVEALRSYFRPFGGVTVSTSPAGGSDRVVQSPVFAALFRHLGLFGTSGQRETRFPSFFWDLSQRQRRVIVAGLWDGGGSHVVEAESALARTSQALIDDAYHCFSLDGLFPIIRDGRPSQKLLSLGRAQDFRRFVELYPLRHPSKRRAYERAAAASGREQATDPRQGAGLRDAASTASPPPEKTAEAHNRRATDDLALGAPRSALSSVSSLSALAPSRLACLRVVDVQEVRPEYLYDLSVEGCENFVANGILAHNSGYPDCRPEYIEAFERMANLATRAGVEGRSRFRVHTPLIAASKAEIVRRARDLGVDLGLTWSCYDPQPDGRPCGVCDSCVLRRKGFAEAEVADPLGPPPR